MNVTITINTDNEMFTDHPDAAIADVLTELASRIRRKGLDSVSRVMDVNGNSVGYVNVQETLEPQEG